MSSLKEISASKKPQQRVTNVRLDNDVWAQLQRLKKKYRLSIRALIEIAVQDLVSDSK